MSKQDKETSKHDKDKSQFHKTGGHFHIKRADGLRAAPGPDGVELAFGDHQQAMCKLTSEEAESLGHWLLEQGKAATRIVKDGA